MRYAVEARVFDNGKIITKVRPAEEGETDSNKDTAKCDIWIDIFDTRYEAEQFARQYEEA